MTFYLHIFYTPSIIRDAATFFSFLFDKSKFMLCRCWWVIRKILLACDNRASCDCELCNEDDNLFGSLRSSRASQNLWMASQKNWKCLIDKSWKKRSYYCGVKRARGGKFRISFRSLAVCDMETALTRISLVHRLLSANAKKSVCAGEASSMLWKKLLIASPRAAIESDVGSERAHVMINWSTLLIWRLNVLFCNSSFLRDEQKKAPRLCLACGKIAQNWNSKNIIVSCFEDEFVSCDTYRRRRSFLCNQLLWNTFPCE